MSNIKTFLAELQRGWPDLPTAAHVFGAGALALRHGYERGTRDADVLKLADLTVDRQQSMLDLGGPQSELARTWHVHIELVENGVPFLPQRPLWHPVDLGVSSTLSLWALDVADVAVSKLKRFHANDRADIAAMVDQGHLDHARLVERFRSAVDGFLGDAREDQLPRFVRNLHQAERDFFDEPPTEIPLPAWIE